MKKRLVSLLLLAAILLTMISGAGATVPICFVAMNDTIPLNLKGGATPYYTNGKLYLPYTAFNISPNGVGATYNVEQQTFVLFNANEQLIFDLERDVYTDKREKSYDVDVAYRSGMLYVPASVCSHFGLSVTLLTSRGGYSIIRFTNGQQVYDDGTFVAQAENLINRAAQEYAQELELQGQGQQPGAEDPVETDPVEAGPIEVYLAFKGDAVSQDTLDALEKLGVRAAFFLTEEQILMERDLVRAIYAAGHTVGITGPGEGNWNDALVRANDALDRVLFCRSVFAMVPAGVSITLNSVHAMTEPVPVTMEELLSSAQEPQLYVVSSGALGVIASLANTGASILKLRETTF